MNDPGQPRSLVFFVLLLAVTHAGCGDSASEDAPFEAACPEDFDAAEWLAATPELDFATNLSFEELPFGNLVTVGEPWPGASEAQRYLLLVCGSDPADAAAWKDESGIEVDATVEVPVSRVVTTSTPQLAHFDALDGIEQLVGHGELDWIYSPRIRRAAEAGALLEVGDNAMLDLEQLVGLAPDVFLAYDAGEPRFLAGDRLTRAGINVVYYADYLEETPLGQAEWLRLTARLLGRGEAADALINKVAKEYRQLEDRIEALRRQPGFREPTVLLGAPWQGTWWVAGGDSFMAQLIRDAGGEYVFNDRRSRTGVPMTLERVFVRAHDADVWLNPSDHRSLAALAQADPRFQNLAAFKRALVWNNDRRRNDLGGNDFWESGAIRPDRVLSDLAAILHPGLEARESLVYFRKLDP